jgi:hypothetical protein
MLLGPGKGGYGLVLQPGPRALVDAASAEFPRFAGHWRGIETLLKRQGHKLGVQVHFGRSWHRLVRFERHPDGDWPSIDIVYVIRVDAVMIDLAVIAFSEDP